MGFPRSRRFYRPLLEDIHRVAVTWRRRWRSSVRLNWSDLPGTSIAFVLGVFVSVMVSASPVLFNFYIVDLPAYLRFTFNPGLFAANVVGVATNSGICALATFVACTVMVYAVFGLACDLAAKSARRVRQPIVRVRSGFAAAVFFSGVACLLVFAPGYSSHSRFANVTPDEQIAMSTVADSLSGYSVDESGHVTQIHFHPVPLHNKDALRYLPELERLERLSLADTDVGDTECAVIAGCPSLRSLDVFSTQVTSEGLNLLVRELPPCQIRVEREKFQTIPPLELTDSQKDAIAAIEALGGIVIVDEQSGSCLVSFSDMQGTDTGFEHLKELPNLSELNLNSTRVNDAALEHLNGLSDFQALSVAGTQITDTGLAHLAKLSSLRELNLNGTQVGDAGLEHLTGLTNLQTLSADGTQVTDTGLEHLTKFTSLRELHLSDTQVTDAGMEHLKWLINLHRLELYRTRVTDSAAHELKAALPDCQIRRDVPVNNHGHRAL